MQTELSLFEVEDKKKSIVTVEIEKCELSKFNPRITRPKEYVERLAERIKRNGFEVTRAVWVYSDNEKLKVFAGGTRFEAAKMAGLSELPVVILLSLYRLWQGDLLSYHLQSATSPPVHRDIQAFCKWAPDHPHPAIRRKPI